MATERCDSSVYFYVSIFPVPTQTWRTHLPQQVALKLQSLIHQKHNITSIIRSSSQITDLQTISPSIKTLVLSLEDSPVSDFTQAFQDADADVVVFSAGAGGQGGAERTKKVDYEGAVKVFDAIDGLPEERRQKTRLVIVSGIDLKPDFVPEHYVSTHFPFSLTMILGVRMSTPESHTSMRSI